jgi:hypothetical protein
MPTGQFVVELLGELLGLEELVLELASRHEDAAAGFSLTSSGEAEPDRGTWGSSLRLEVPTVEDVCSSSCRLEDIHFDSLDLQCMEVCCVRTCLLNCDRAK